MQDDRYDDGLVHSHGWTQVRITLRPPHDHAPANAAAARTPSTVTHDDLLFRD